MAAFNPKPWFKQPANSDVKVRDNPQPYFYGNLSDIFVSEIPKAVTPGDLTLVLENISISYELFNDLSIWGFVNYPELRKFFMHDTKIYGTKISFGDDNFLPFSKKDEFRLLRDFKVGEADYKKLGISQQYIVNLMNDYARFVKKMNGRFLSVCKTVGPWEDFDKTIITWAGQKTEKSAEEAKELVREGRVPLGRKKGMRISDLPEKYVREELSKKRAKKDYRIALQEAFPHLINKSSIGSASKKKKTKKGRRGKKKKTAKNSVKPTLMYFYMVGCHSCEEFEDTWKKVQNKIKDVTFKKINGRDGAQGEREANKYGVTSYPALVKVVGRSDELLIANNSKERSLKKIKEFMNKS
tara:strand:+ start:44 stop:1108 length:1065 start_codon:yes stop_codon:yes gene_type:complete